MSSRLKVACWNVQGLKPWKVNDNDFINHLKGNDIVFLIDTCAERDFRFDIEGFHFYLKPRRSNAGKDISLGGIAVLMRSDLRKPKGVRILEEQFITNVISFGLSLTRNISILMMILIWVEFTYPLPAQII